MSIGCSGPWVVADDVAVAEVNQPGLARIVVARDTGTSALSATFKPAGCGNPVQMREILERETKWDVDERFTLPDLDDLVKGGTVAHDTVHMANTYYDTPLRDLEKHGILLRRREGGDETGWQLKIPSAGGRTELQWPMSDAPPSELVDLLTGITLGKPLFEIANIHTLRQRYRINDKRELLAELADDHVTADANDRHVAWREVEVELGPHTAVTPKRLRKRLTAAGAHPSQYPSKLAHAVAPPPADREHSAAASALARYLTAQIDQMVAGDVGLRRGEDPIHDTRVAIRRLRSTLRVFKKVMDEDAVANMNDELRWFAELLGKVRDCQVQCSRFMSALDEFPDELVVGPVRPRIRIDLRKIELPARAEVSEAMNSERYLAIMAVLQRWRADAPLFADLGTGALIKCARRAERKADRRLAAANESEDDEMLHGARKAAKRARYAAELVKPLGKPKSAKRTIAHYKRVQDVLGEHQDTVVASAALRRIAIAAGTTPGENGFTFGLLYAREQRIARQRRIDARVLL